MSRKRLVSICALCLAVTGCSTLDLFKLPPDVVTETIYVDETCTLPTLPEFVEVYWEEIDVSQYVPETQIDQYTQALDDLATYERQLSDALILHRELLRSVCE